MTLAARSAMASQSEWTRIPGAAAAWSRSDGATLHRDTYAPTFTATRVSRSGQVEAQSFYTVDEAMTWLGPVAVVRFPARDLTGAVFS